MKKLLLILTPFGLVGAGLYLWAAWPANVVAVAQTPAVSTCYDTAITTSEIIRLTNIERSQAGLSPLVERPELDNAARLKAGDMITAHYWAHTSPTGTTPWAWFDQVGYHYVYAGENLSEAYKTPAGVLRGWMASPEHRANILKPAYTEVGVAVLCGITDKSTTLVVAEYGSR